MRNFWLIYLITAAAATVGVYVAAPMARPLVPNALKRAPVVADSRQPADAKAADRSTAAPSPVAPMSQVEEVDELPPALHGIYLARSNEKPGWGITRHAISYYLPNGTRVGQVDGGVLFDFQNTRTSSKGNMVECILHGENIPATPMLVNTADVLLFTGDYRKLSPVQLAALNQYYALSGKIAARKKELLQESAQKNPFFATYQASYNTLTRHTEQAKELTAQRDKAMDSERMRIEDKLREMKLAEIQIRKDYDAIHQKFRAWKDQHANELTKPENDASIQQWMQQQTDLLPRVPGLAY